MADAFVKYGGLILCHVHMCHSLRHTRTGRVRWPYAHLGHGADAKFGGVGMPREHDDGDPVDIDDTHDAAHAL